MPTRLSYFSPELALAIDPACAAALFTALEAPRLAALARRRGRDSLALARALWAKPLPWVLADVLDELARLGTSLGRDALVEAARDTRAPHDGWEDEAPVDVAARLLADRIMQNRRLVRAHLRLGRLMPERPTYELRGAAPRKATSTRALGDALREVAGGAWSEAWVSEDEEGTLHAALLYTMPAERIWDADRKGPRGEALRRVVRADAFRFLANDARLLVTTARPQRLDAYAAAWGAALYGDARFFLKAPSLTLKPLQRLGREGLSGVALPRDVVRARVIACQLDTGDADRLEVRGPGALARLAPHLRAGGYLTRATIRFDVFGEIRPIDAVLEVPHRLEIGPGGAATAGTRPARVVRDALAQIGLLSPGAIADDVTTLLPLVHAEWRWREIVGEEGLAAMTKAGLFEPVAAEKTRRAAVQGLRRVGRSAVAFGLYRPMQGKGTIDPTAPEVERNLVKAMIEADRVLTEHNEYYTVPEDWSIPAVTLRKSEMAMQRLVLARVVAKGRREMGIARGERGVKVPKGVCHVGDLRVDSGVVRFFYVVRAAVGEKERAALGRGILRATGFGRAVALVPKGRKLGRDFVEIELDVREQLGAAGWRDKLAEAVAALGIAGEIEAWRLAGEGVRVVVDARRERVALDGVPLVKMAESGVRLLRALAGRKAAVPTKETDRVISGARQTDGTTRDTVYKMRRWIAESFEAAGKAVPADVEENGLVTFVKGEGWRLTWKGEVR
jgi:hypothetical protein